ncbi:YheC/YheD family protein [Bacillus taeanensis]|uniref:YheC/YheD family protein n=1 Tax=Bacillus taeanensis TaxID=273032 RepID=A0A366XSU3_9BACI|nr:YheC/YheD family protein [Bacillus taeanensis]RBW69450.1 YheC/YheD family protein [Bacillus taeanensis]
MNPNYKIIPDLHYQNCLTIPANTAKQNKLLTEKKWFIRFGIQAVEIKLKISSQLNENEIKLSIRLIDLLRIPLSGRYEIRLEDNEIRLGPYFGILAAAKKETLNRIVHYLSNHLYNYDCIGGAVGAFSLEGINTSEQTMEGYVYNPETGEWEQGIYSYPTALFKIIYLNKQWRNHFQTVLGKRIFNSYVFNKWEMYKWFKEVPQLSSHLPETMLYKSPEDLESFLEKHSTMYVKPVNGSMGIGVFKVSKTTAKFKVEFDEEGTSQVLLLSNIFDLADFFKSQFKDKKYILQEAIKMISDKGQNIDFRIAMVKNEAGVWKEMIMVAKYGKSGSVVTNIKAGGSAELAEVTLKKMFGLSDEEVFRWRKDISQLALKAVEHLERVGIHCGNLGIDLAIDAETNIWIIEINNLNPDPLIALDVNNRQIFYQIKLMNMLYAKKLAGFGED